MTKLPPIDALKALNDNPGQIHISDDGEELYVSHPSGIHLFTGPDFGDMSAEEISSYLRFAFK